MRLIHLYALAGALVGTPAEVFPDEVSPPESEGKGDSNDLTAQEKLPERKLGEIQ